MQNTERKEIVANDLGNGPLGWFLHMEPEEINGGSFLGRLVALYDHVKNGMTMLLPFQEPEARGKALAVIGNWAESQAKRVRLVYSRICADCRGIGRAQVLDENVSLDDVEKWYKLQKDALAASDILRKVLHKVWGGNSSAMLEALNVPGFVFTKWNSWTCTMGPDAVACVEAAFIPMIRTEDGYRLFFGEDWKSRELPEKYDDYANVREDFAGAWSDKEKELLALPAERRSEAWEN